jgi:spore germination protein (amino acid permease)
LINNRQLALLLFIILMGETSAYIPGLMASAAGEGSWLPIIINSVIFGFGAFIIVKLGSQYEGKMLYEYSGEIIGKAGAFILGSLFIIYFLIVTVYLLVSFTNMLKNNFLYNTPSWFELLLGIPVFGYAAYKGVRNVARMAEITGIILLIVALLIHTAMFAQGKIQNILPLFNPQELGRYLSAMKEGIVPFLGIEVLTIVPFALSAKKKAPKVAFLSVVAIGIFFIFIIETSVMMVGIEDIVNYTDPLVVALRRVELEPIEFLTRIDIFYLTIGFAGFFVYLIVEYCAVVEYL